MGTKQWDRRFGGSSLDWLQDVRQTSDGGYILGGISSSGSSGDRTQPSQGDTDYWVVKLDATGTKQWDRAYGGTGFDYLRKLMPTSDGGYLLCGDLDSPSSGDKTQASSQMDIWVVKAVDCLIVTLFLGFNAFAQSAPTWQSARVVGYTFTIINATVVDLAGNTYHVGQSSAGAVLSGTSLPNVGETDVFVAKYTPSGTQAWVRYFGSTERDAASGVAVDAAGNVYVTGYFEDTIALGNNQVLVGNPVPPSRSMFVIRYSPQGSLEWAQQDIPTFNNSVGSSNIATDANGSVYVAGHFFRGLRIGPFSINIPSTGNGGGFLARFSTSTGAVQSLSRSYYYDLANNFGIFSPQLAVTATGKAYVLINFRQNIIVDSNTLTSRGNVDVLVVKHNELGTVEWAQQLGGSNEEQVANGVADITGNLYLAGSFNSVAQFDTTTLTSRGDRDAFLAKYSPQGGLMWAQVGAGPGADRWNNVGLDGAGNPYVTGDFAGTAQFGQRTLTSSGSFNVLTAAYTPQGQVRWVQQAGGSGSDSGSFIGCDAQGTVYVRGCFVGSASFVPFTLTTATTNNEIFLGRLVNTLLGVKSARSLPLSLYPNPITASTTATGIPAGSQVQLLDAVGHIAHSSISSLGGTISLLGVALGLYIVRATDVQGHQYTSG
jgi:hypothetical protein